jgi:FKBP-type peptidyl-prolyl cis-trans isomerase 2
MIMSETTLRKVRVGDRVRVAYVGRFPDGTEFDTSLGNPPLVFTVGAGEVIPGFEQGVVGMQLGESRTVVVAPAEGYGLHVPEMVAEVERKLIPDDDQLVVGNFLEVRTEDGTTFEVQIKQLTDTMVVLDGNHPLSGKDLHFEIELLDFV